MKAKKFLALVLALVMALSCMSLTALAAFKDCHTCKGEGKIACTVEGCENRKVPCPYCEGTKKDTCRDCKGEKCSGCKGTGGATMPCESCAGDDKDCQECSGTGSVPKPCEDCSGNDKDCYNCKSTSGIEPCDTCNGTGNKDCYLCSSTGIADCSRCGLTGRFPCYACCFTGGFITCTNCKGADAILDLEPDDTYHDHTTIDQLYDVAVTEKRTDVTKVLVSWELKNIQASVTSNKIWDTEKLEWVNDTTKENGAEVEDGTAEFTFVNLSSVKIDAQVTFAVAEGFTAITPEFSNSKITLGTKADGEDVKNNGEITVTVTPDAKDFATLTEDATNVKYGTYTVTIGKTPVYKLKKGDLIYMNLTAAEGNEMYRVIKVDGTKVELLAMEDAEVKMAYDADKTTTDFGGGTMGAKYAGSDLDTYLNETWFNNLSDTAQKAIVAKTIKQDMWNDNWDDGEKTLSDKYVDIGERFVYALSMSEVQDYLEMALKNDADMKKAVLNMFYSDGKKHSTSLPYLRSTRVSNSPDYVYAWCVDGGYGSLDRCTVISTATAARPALTIDLSMMGADCWSYADQ